MNTSISKKLNLSNVLDRILLLQYMVNLTRVFQAIAKMVPEDAPKLGGKYEIPRQYSGKYSTLVFETAFVEKVLLNMLGSMAHFDFDTLKELYKLVQEKQGGQYNPVQEKLPRAIRRREGRVVDDSAFVSSREMHLAQ